MRPIRNCSRGDLNTGTSKCALDLSNVIGAVLVEPGTKFPANATASSLREACHADRPNRFMPVMRFVEYSKDGGEPNVSSVGYGGNKVASVGARTDNFTLDNYYPELAAALSKAMNKPYDVFYFDENNVVYGLRDGDDLAGFPLTTVYPGATPHPTSSNPATLIASFAFENARDAIEDFDFVELDFNVANALVGLTKVELVKTATSGNKYKLLEAVGGYDVTSQYGPAIAEAASSALNGASSATYNAADETLTITVSEGATPSLKAPSALYTAGIEGITG